MQRFLKVLLLGTVFISGYVWADTAHRDAIVRLRKSGQTVLTPTGSGTAPVESNPVHDLGKAKVEADAPPKLVSLDEASKKIGFRLKSPDKYEDVGLDEENIFRAQFGENSNVAPVGTNEIPVQVTNLGDGTAHVIMNDGTVLKNAGDGFLTTDGKVFYKLNNSMDKIYAVPRDTSIVDGSGIEITRTINPDGTVSYAAFRNGEQVNMSEADMKEAFDANYTDPDPSALEQTVASNDGNAASEVAAATAAAGAVKIDKAIIWNVFEYALQILEAVEGIHQDDATKEVTVKGTQSLQNSQGGSSDYSTGTDVSLEATTIASAAELMVELLRNNPMNLTYLDETKCADYKEDTSTRRECLQEMKKISANATALSGVMIAEGSNAISSKFYDRIKNFTDINNNLGTGSLGAMSVINDAERYPYFEMVRGTALSAVQLGVKEMGTLTELDDLAKEAENAQ